MRLKPLPEPPGSLSVLAEYQRAVPLVPGSEDDCCARLRDRSGLADRDVANDWLALLRALGLVEETPRGFRRTDADPTVERVRRGLREEVLFAPAAVDRLRTATPAEPVTADDLFASIRESVPRHDRFRDPNWETTWRERSGRLFRWFALVDLATPVDPGRAAETGTHTDGAGRAYVAGDAVAE